MQIGVKADLLCCLESDLLKITVADAVILGIAAVIQMLSPGTSRAFQDYEESVFSPYISGQLKKSSCINLVQYVIYTYLPA